MKILLTGGAGYIGSHIAACLLEMDYDVIIADNFSNSCSDVPERLHRLSGKMPITYEINVADKEAMDGMFRENKPDAVIHLAGFKAVGESVEKPLMYYKNNLESTIRLIETMKNHDVKHLIFSSSATVYGDLTTLPYTEDMKSGEIANPYGRTKYMIEQIIIDEVAAGGLNAVILRYFNPVGAHKSGLLGEQPQGIPNNLMPYISQVAARVLTQLKVFGNDYPTKDGTGVRDYIHVVDLAKGHVAAIDYCQKHPGVEIINLGTGRGCSVLELVETFERVNNIKIPFEMAPRRAGDLAECFADVTKAGNLLDWKAELGLDDMCRDTFNSKG